jgi:hypothetical protein
MTSHSTPTRPSTLPDYYGDERRALKRVRARQSVRWLGLVAAAATLLVWKTAK